VGGFATAGNGELALGCFFVVSSAPPPHQLYRAQVLFDQTNHRTYARVKVSFGATLAAFNARRLF